MNILVLMGGGSAEREISLQTGAGIVTALRKRGHRVVAGDPATGRLESGEHLALAEEAGPAGGEAAAAAALDAPSPVGESDGADERTSPPRVISEAVISEAAISEAAIAEAAIAERALTLIGSGEAAVADVVLIALHGGVGEDGRVQTLLELAGRTYTGSGPLASGLAMDKVMAKRLFVWAGVPTPEWVDLRVPEARALAREATAPSAGAAKAPPPGLACLGEPPVVVKPVSQGSTIGLSILHAWQELPRAVELASGFDDRILLERYIPGRELAIGILGDHALPIVEIEPTKGVYDYECKYTKGMSRYSCPARIEGAVTREVQDVALKAFRTLGCADFGRVDVRLAPDDRPYVLEVNTIPGMTATSLLPMAAGAVGISYEELVEKMCELALSRRQAPRGPTASEVRPASASLGAGEG
jgi:D-alanine-D-alanine ligase